MYRTYISDIFSKIFFKWTDIDNIYLHIYMAGFSYIKRPQYLRKYILHVQRIYCIYNKFVLSDSVHYTVVVKMLHTLCSIYKMLTTLPK